MIFLVLSCDMNSENFAFLIQIYFTLMLYTRCVFIIQFWFHLYTVFLFSHLLCFNLQLINVVILSSLNAI